MHSHLEHLIYPEDKTAYGHDFRREYMSNLGMRIGAVHATPTQLVDIEFLQALIQAIELTPDPDDDLTPDTYPILQRLSNDLFSGTSYIVLDDSAVCCSMINSHGDCYTKQMKQVLISFINTLVYKTEEYADLNFQKTDNVTKLPSKDPSKIAEALLATITWMPLYVVGILAADPAGDQLLQTCLSDMGLDEDMIETYAKAIYDAYTETVSNIWNFNANDSLFNIDNLVTAYIQQKNFVENGNPGKTPTDPIPYLPHQQTFTLSPGAYLYNIIASSEIVQHLRNTTKQDFSPDSGCCNGNRLNLMYVNMCSNGTSNKSLVDITKLNVNKFHDLTIFHGTGPNQNRPILMTKYAKLDLQPNRYQAEAAGIFGSHAGNPLGYLNYTMNRMKPEKVPDPDDPKSGYPVHYPNIITAKQLSLAARLDDKRKVDKANTEEVAPDNLGCGPNQCVTLNVIPRTSNGTMGAIKNLPGGLGAILNQGPPDPLLATRKNTGNDSNENPFSFLPTRYQIPNEFLSTLDEKGNVNYLDDFVIEFMEDAFTPGIFQGGGKRQFNTGQCNSTYDLSSGTLSFSTGSKSCKRVCEKGAKLFGATDGDGDKTKCDGIMNCYTSLFVHYMHNNDKGKVLKDPGSNDLRPDACQNNCYTYSKFIVGRDNLSQLEGESLVGGWTGLRKDLGTKIRPRKPADVSSFNKEDIANGFASNIYHNICAIKQDASDGGKGAKVKGGIKSAFINVDYQVNDKFILADPVQEDEINPNDPISLGDNFIVAKYNDGYYTDNMSITTPLVGIYDDLSTLSQIRQTTGFSQHSWLNHTDGALGLGFIFMQAFCSGGGGGTVLCNGNGDDRLGSLCDNQAVTDPIPLPEYPVSDPYAENDMELVGPIGFGPPDCDLTLEERVESCEVTEEPGIEPTGEPAAEPSPDLDVDEESDSELDSELDSE